MTVQDSTVFLENPENDANAIPGNTAGVVIIGLDETRDAINYLEINDLIIKMNGNNISTIAEQLRLRLRLPGIVVNHGEGYPL